VKVTRRRGIPRLQLEPVEAHILESLLDELASTLESDGLDAADPVRQRLFPAAYRGDAEAEAEFRSLTEFSLRTERTERARQCAEQLNGGATDIAFDAESGQRWIQVLNDLRLALGTRLGITEDDGDLDPNDRDFQQRSVYYWLTAVQDSLVRALMK
jgi:hypothetical protein